MKKSITLNICVLVIGMMFVSNVVAQSSSEYSIPGTAEHILTSETNGSDNKIMIALPEGYDENREDGYPAFYVLDGNLNFPTAVQTQRVLTQYRIIPPMILVGIGYPVDYFSETLGLRWNDYSISGIKELDKRYGESINDTTIVSGGADDFLFFLEHQVTKFIDSTYNTNNDRGIWGHSLGGLFTAYALLKKPQLFDRYAISSGSLDWNNAEILDLQKEFAAGNDSLSADVLLSVGEWENEDLMDAMHQFYEDLNSSKYKGLEVTSVQLKDENHITVVPSAISRALRVLYAPKRE